MKTRPLPIAICLLASGISCVISIVQGVPFSRFVFNFAMTALVFYIFGVIVRVVIDRAFKIDAEETQAAAQSQEEEQFEVSDDDADREAVEGEDVSVSEDNDETSESEEES